MTPIVTGSKSTASNQGTPFAFDDPMSPSPTHTGDRNVSSGVFTASPTRTGDQMPDLNAISPISQNVGSGVLTVSPTRTGDRNVSSGVLTASPTLTGDQTLDLSRTSPISPKPRTITSPPRVARKVVPSKLPKKVKKGSSRVKKQPGRTTADDEATPAGKGPARSNGGGKKARADGGAATVQPSSRPQRNAAASLKVLADRAQQQEAAAEAAAEAKAKEERRKERERKKRGC